MHTVKVLGSGCANCERLAALTGQALGELGRSEQVEKVTDYAAMAALGVMATPALAVDDQVVLAGRIPALAALKDTLAERLEPNLSHEQASRASPTTILAVDLYGPALAHQTIPSQSRCRRETCARRHYRFRVRQDLPAGTVTFLFTDIAGSTRLLQEHGSAYRTFSQPTARSCAARFAGTRGSRWTRRETRSSQRSPGPRMPLPQPPRCVTACGTALFAFASGSTPESRWSPRRATSASTSTVRRASPPRHTAGRSCSRRRHATSLDPDRALRDLGEHRLKDLVEAERLFQLGDGEFPPLRTLDATNLPVAASPLLGREREVAELVELLGDSTAGDGHRAGRHGQDAARAPGRGRARRRGLGRCLLGPSRPAH